MKDGPESVSEEAVLEVFLTVDDEFEMVEDADEEVGTAFVRRSGVDGGFSRVEAGS